jgi:hypothetical protein
MMLQVSLQLPPPLLLLLLVVRRVGWSMAWAAAAAAVDAESQGCCVGQHACWHLLLAAWIAFAASDAGLETKHR